MVADCKACPCVIVLASISVPSINSVLLFIAETPHHLVRVADLSQHTVRYIPTPWFYHETANRSQDAMTNKSHEASFNFSNSFTDWALEQPPRIWYNSLVFPGGWWKDFLLAQISTLQSIVPPTKPPSARNKWLNHQPPTNCMNFQPWHLRLVQLIQIHTFAVASEARHISKWQFSNIKKNKENSLPLQHSNVNLFSWDARPHPFCSRFVDQMGKVAHEKQHALDLSHEAIHMYSRFWFSTSATILCRINANCLYS